MPFIPTDELAELRADMYADVLDEADTADGGVARVHRFSEGSDGFGGTADVWTPAESYPCRIVQRLFAEPREVDIGGGVGSTASWHVKMPWNAPVAKRDKLEITTDDGIPRMFEVLDTDSSKSDRMMLTVSTRRITE